MPHILGPVPNRKSRLGANICQLLVVEICQNTCTSCDKMLQLLQNHSVFHHTDSQRSSTSFLWFQIICGSITIFGFQRSHNLDGILDIFFIFLSLELKITVTTKPYSSNMTGNYQTSTICSIIKFQNSLPSGWAKFHQKLKQNHQLFAFYSCYCE